MIDRTEVNRALAKALAYKACGKCIAYVGKLAGGRGFEGRLGSESPYHELTNWHGNVIGTIRLGKGWSIRSCYSDRMYQAYATIDGVQYTGRTLGEGMPFAGKRCAKQ